MDQPVPNVRKEDVERIVRRDFGETDFDKVKAILEEYGDLGWRINPHRVRLAVLKLSKGDLDELRRQIEVAKCDYRDVLAYAEYPEYMRTVLPGADLSKEQKSKIVERDWAQYENWLQRG